jgi:hypothetical protein
MPSRTSSLDVRTFASRRTNTAHLLILRRSMPLQALRCTATACCTPADCRGASDKVCQRRRSAHDMIGVTPRTWPYLFCGLEQLRPASTGWLHTSVHVYPYPAKRSQRSTALDCRRERLARMCDAYLPVIDPG